MMDPELESALLDEVTGFADADNAAHALRFAPTNSFIRFQIHQLVQNNFGTKLKTFSVGDGNQRRLVVGWLSKWKEPTPPEPTVTPTATPTATPMKAPADTPPTKQESGKKRPDRQVYVPKHRRGAPANVSTSNPAPKLDPVSEIKARLGDDVEIIDSAISLPKAHGGGGPGTDFPVGSEETVLEIYDFPVAYKTNDVKGALHRYHNKYDLKWVDDTHALAVFMTETLAEQALADTFSGVKLRPLASATEASKEKATVCCLSTNLPRVPRPETSTLVARRMMGGALGMKLVSKDKETEEKEKLRKARQKKKEEKEQQNE